jgi:uncharacterized protein YjiS (DUF1127 family)
MRTMYGNVSLPDLAVPRRLGRSLVLGFLTLEERRRQRAALMALDDRLLKDIGLSRADVERECGRPIWR